jgi:hypothetical protein
MRVFAHEGSLLPFSLLFGTNHFFQSCANLELSWL